MVQHPKLVRAEWLAPMDRRPIRDGAVVFSDGVIVHVGFVENLEREFPHAEVTDLGRSVLLPGLVNAHLHLELSTMSAGHRPASFVDWVLGVLPRTPSNPAALEKNVAAAIQEGVRQCLRFGVTTVGDISRHCTHTRHLLKEGPLRVTSFGEVLAMGQRRSFLEPRLSAATDRSNDSAFLRAGITPHAPYSVEAEGYRRCLAAARQHSMPLATHLAETRDEAEFVANHSGSFRQLWDTIGGWDEKIPRFKGGPLRFAKSLGLLDYPTLLAHVNYCDDEELALLAAGQATVVYCPRTHAYFGHPPHRWRDMLSAGINVAVGTDSCASSPDLNLVDDLRLMHYLAPDVPAQVLWEMATVRAARALGLEDSAGSISNGKFADLVAFPSIGSNPLQGILEEPVFPSELWISGIPVRKHGNV